MAGYKILSTRSLDPLLVQEATLAGFTITEKEFIRIAPIETPEKKKEIEESCSQYLPVVFTSANAVHAVKTLSGSSRLDVCCISGQTKEAVKKLFPSANILAEANNASGLAQQIIHSRPDAVLFFCGNRRRDELPDMLRSAGITVQEVIVYETIETPVALNKGFDGVLFFSPSAVDSFFSANALEQKTTLFAIGNTTAAAIRKFSKNEVIISNSADPKAMLLAAQQHFLINKQQ